jgi:antitoxin (DNA-binding transcriptional repressor) of toxin-antitoxin stability system
MHSVSLAEISRDPHQFIRQVEAGEEIVLTRDTRPIAEVKPVPAAPSAKRPFGLCAGEFVVPDDFDAPLPDDVVEDFEGR